MLLAISAFGCAVVFGATLYWEGRAFRRLRGLLEFRQEGPSPAALEALAELNRRGRVSNVLRGLATVELLAEAIVYTLH